MNGSLLTFGGALLMCATSVFRAGRTPATRWWLGSPVNERMILAGLPGLALMLIGAGELLVFPDAGDLANVALVLVVLVGSVIAMWSALALPVPRWAMPGWLRRLRPTTAQRRTRAKAGE